ncbi:MAG: SpoVK/Ycf46/Vps4 family AAA+-type ATPase [Bacteroidia bacterium]|jgi:SpoVK/Ycf46/Vps4 family AAA+-type ATPase
MATSNQIKALIRSHYTSDRESFTTFALQLAAHEAKKGHYDLAHTIRDLVDESKSKPSNQVQFAPELESLIIPTMPNIRLSELIVSEELLNRINRILREYLQREKLKKHGLTNRRKILLAGPPGTGKTLTASVIATELRMPLNTILMDKMVTKFMGGTSAKLRQIFDVIRKRRGVYLFDEFDAIGAERGRENEVGEMRRILNSFLQFIEQDSSDSLIVAATNNPQILDHALFRRFDDVLYYDLPNESEIIKLIENRLGQFRRKGLSLKSVLQESATLSHSEITQACDNAIKEAILSDQSKVTAKLLSSMVRERRLAYQSKVA